MRQNKQIMLNEIAFVILGLADLNKNYIVSSYNKGTNEQIDFYLDKNACKNGDTVCLYSHKNDILKQMEIINAIQWSKDQYICQSSKIKNILHDGEIKYKSDASLEFTSDNDCYLVWLRNTDN